MVDQRGFRFGLWIAALVIATVGPVAPIGPAAGAASATADATETLYVKPCTGSGNGSWERPFCTPAAAEAAVRPGRR